MAHTEVEPVEQPAGSTSGKWFHNGYRAAMADIAELVDTPLSDNLLTDKAERLNRIREWIEANSHIRFY